MEQQWRWRLTALFVVSLVLLATLPSTAEAGQPKVGGTMRFALEGEPPTLDPHWATATVVMTVGSHWLETLFTQGAKYEIIPDLAEGYTVEQRSQSVRYRAPRRCPLPQREGDDLRRCGGFAQPVGSRSPQTERIFSATWTKWRRWTSTRSGSH